LQPPAAAAPVRLRGPVAPLPSGSTGRPGQTRKVFGAGGLARAQRKAGDLAHGLKTPLAVLGREAERAREAGHPALADAIAVQVDRMRRQIDYQLSQARAAAGGVTSGVRCAVVESADALARTMLALHAERGIALDTAVDAGHVVRAEREDLEEMLGNLLDNACKWARTTVRVSSARVGGDIALVVDDDGPGVEASQRDAVLARGVRADETAPGSGLGLAIVRDLADLHGGAVALGDSPLGGLRVTLTLPAA
ncbi:MAG: sensor histidine kinase, partial [Vicinamibacteria bacterium]